MTDETKDNIIIGPWTGHNKVNSEDAENWVKKKYDRALEKNTTQLEMQSKILKVDSITENIMVQLIHTLSEKGYDISEQKFILDIGFLSETIKGIISRQEKLPHIVQGLIDKLMSPEETRNEDGVDLYYSRFDVPLLSDLVDMAGDIKEETKTEVDIEFEPDTTLHDVTNWNLNKDDEEDK